MFATISHQAMVANTSVCQQSVDPEFQNLIPPLTTEEVQLLEANLKEFGCLQPLVVWKGHNILLDGHNRYRLCAELQIPYSTVEIELADRSEAIAWIANNQLGRRNITPETASYLRGKRYSLLKGNSLDNLKQNSPKGQNVTSVDTSEQLTPPNSPKGQNVTSVDTAEQLAQLYKVSSRTIKRDAQFSEAIDTLTLALGAEIKQDILGRSAKITKKETLMLLKVVKNQGKEAARHTLERLRNRCDIVQQIKDKKRVPNPRHVGEVCQIMARGDAELKQVSGCWCIIVEVKTHSCTVRTWRMDFDAVKSEHLEPIDGVDEQKAARVCSRIRQLTNKVYENFDPTHAAALEAFGSLSNPASLTPKQERLLAFLETEYGLPI